MRIKLLTVFLFVTFSFVAAQEKVYLDKQGVVRWMVSKEEVKLFGANYCLPSACDYRAASYVDADRREMIREDLDHFKRMGFDGLRLCFWGDRQNSDALGNLVENDHLDLFDRLVAEATERNIYMLLSPIVTYDSQWPEMSDTTNTGFILKHEKGRFVHDRSAIRAQKNYLCQLLNHMNPYTHRLVKDEPNILFLELVNEPVQFPDDLQGMEKYINELCEAVKSIGCKKLLFYNVSQDFRVSKVIHDSHVDGSTSAWYPTGLDNGHRVKGNGLLWVDRYEQLHNKWLEGKAKLIYEFDTPDKTSGYMYPAMVREFRHGGIQFATLFSYDMLRTAPRNIGWRTEYFNMVYTPHKAVSAMIAAEAMRRLPMGKGYGYYPKNNSFGDFKVNFEEKLSLLNADTTFYYSNTCKELPKCVQKLRHIAGVGSSPIVNYTGNGIYFLDKINSGLWTLEVYPDIDEVTDPFAEAAFSVSVVAKSSCRKQKFTFHLSGLNGGLAVSPGKYLLSQDAHILSYEPLPADSFYRSFQDIPLPDKVDMWVDGENETPVVLVEDGWGRLSYTRHFANPKSEIQVMKDGFHYSVADLTPRKEYLYPSDCTMSFYVADRMEKRNEPKKAPRYVRLLVKGNKTTDRVLVNIVDSEGKGYGAVVSICPERRIVDIPVSQLRPMKAAMLPQDWPGVNSYYFPASLEKYTMDDLDWNKVAWVQVSMRNEIYPSNQLVDKSVTLEKISFVK